MKIIFSLVATSELSAFFRAPGGNVFCSKSLFLVIYLLFTNKKSLYYLIFVFCDRCEDRK